ncbi:MAG: restriction endonuclease subunit S, partial [Nitrosomonas sp.]|nr:restriction endonuclease subunit S [Nitrosomonas sp.]
TQLKASEYVDKGIPVINVRNIGFGDVKKEDLEYLNDAKAEKLHQHHLRKGDIVFGRKGAVERHALIDETVDGWIQGSDCLRLRIRSQDICERYLSHYFKTKAHQDWMQALCSFGATMSSLNQDIVRRISFPAPPIIVQKKITATLTAYDKLIENNQRRIALLEKMAEEIYREWFVRLRFPGYEKVKKVKGVPEGWEIKKLGSVLELCYGKALKDDDRVSGEFHVYGSSGVVGTHNESLVKTPGLIVGRKGNVGSVYWSDRGFFPIDTVYYVKSELPNSFLYFLLRSMNFINNDAAVPGLNRNQAYSNLFFLPPAQLIKRYVEIADSLFKMKRVLTRKNEYLTSMRDKLLPRLISGKLSVEHLDIQFPPGMEESVHDI